ncbi:helix-turn-helix transcriptional regulator [Nocardia yamanashiensis]|uniref:winged helix-turn-helix transcriptional regulator n=1 Tax=Nocardia yamanashiensis TaxID=209247 RepID=UPI001E625311|nr:helix-turn-helix domain-containing protein [Nocardia yamanashiensis]UGT43489.1 helix-turn-helix transcriptional regulator [Nocardia yamanashiensis]
MTMAKRSYNQYCGIAVALDLLGERWSLLVLRNLLLGPKRFKDLLDGLPGIGTGLLSQRLKELDAAGLITRTTLPPPAASTVYHLTPAGESLRPMFLELSRWGLARLGDPAPGQHVDAELVALAMEARFDHDAAGDDADGVYELRVEGQVFRLSITHGSFEIRAGAAESPRAAITTDLATLAALNNGTSSLANALETQAVTVSGDTGALPSLAHAFGIV